MSHRYGSILEWGHKISHASEHVVDRLGAATRTLRAPWIMPKMKRDADGGALFCCGIHPHSSFGGMHTAMVRDALTPLVTQRSPWHSRVVMREQQRIPSPQGWEACCFRQRAKRLCCRVHARDRLWHTIQRMDPQPQPRTVMSHQHARPLCCRAPAPVRRPCTPRRADRPAAMRLCFLGRAPDRTLCTRRQAPPPPWRTLSPSGRSTETTGGGDPERIHEKHAASRLGVPLPRGCM